MLDCLAHDGTPAPWGTLVRRQLFVLESVLFVRPFDSPFAGRVAEPFNASLSFAPDVHRVDIFPQLGSLVAALEEK